MGNVVHALERTKKDIGGRGNESGLVIEEDPVYPDLQRKHPSYSKHSWRRVCASGLLLLQKFPRQNNRGCTIPRSGVVQALERIREDVQCSKVESY